jgi:hypothetical protein
MFFLNIARKALPEARAAKLSERAFAVSEPAITFQIGFLVFLFLHRFRYCQQSAGRRAQLVVILVIISITLNSETIT